MNRRLFLKSACLAGAAPALLVSPPVLACAVPQSGESLADFLSSHERVNLPVDFVSTDDKPLMSRAVTFNVDFTDIFRFALMSEEIEFISDVSGVVDHLLVHLGSPRETNGRPLKNKNRLTGHPLEVGVHFILKPFGMAVDAFGDTPPVIMG